MKIRHIKIIEHNIDLQKERLRIANGGFTSAERLRLTKLMDMFEQGQFESAYNFACKWGPTKNEYPEIEHIHLDVWDIICGASIGVKFEIVDSKD